MNLRFVSWNIHGKKHVSHLLDLLQKYAGDLVALQEVTVPAYQALVESKLFAWSAFSLDLRSPQGDEGRGRRLGCALLGQATYRFKHAFLLEQAPLPERALIVEVESPIGPLTLVSFHAPPSVSWQEKKPLAFLALARWLAKHQTRVLVGMDANTPKTDHPDSEQNECWWDGEPLLLGSRPLHPLRDALRIWLAAHPLEAEQRQALRPDGPNEAWLRTCEKSKIGEVFLNPIRYTHNITSGINKVGRVKRIQQIRRYTCSQKSVPSTLA